MINITYRYVPSSGSSFAGPKDPEEARRQLNRGNKEFSSLFKFAPRMAETVHVIPFDVENVGVTACGAAPVQTPFAAVLGCSDARVPTELIFNQAFNSIFVVRVAGNGLGSECLGSIDYAVENLKSSVKLIVVLGHSGCGAVTCAVNSFVDPSIYLSLNSHSVRSLVDKIFVVVRTAALSLEKQYGAAIIANSGYQQALIDISVVLNAALTANAVRREIRQVSTEQIKVVYGVYQIVTREVSGMEIEGDGQLHQGLFDPPKTEEDFGTLSDLLAESARVKEILQPRK